MGPRPGREQLEREHFDRLAEQTEEIWWGSTTEAGRQRLRRRAHLIAAALERFQDPRVLEVGCGTGALTLPLLEERPALRLCAFDISPRSIEVAAGRAAPFANAKVRIGNALDFDAEDGAFDAVVGNSVLHHLPLEPFVAEAHRLLRPGGLLWFSEPNMLNPQIAVEKNVKPIGRLLQNTPDETAFLRWPLATRLRRAGFSRVEVRPYDFLHPIVPASLIGAVSKLGALFELLPLVREISGSLIVHAIK
jgi:SAM-dependent methyltransferase